MKAGIYKTPNGNLFYVAKDRTIKATTLKPSTWPGLKVSQQGKNVVFLDYVCERIDDVPNGCTDHQGWLDAKYAERVVGPMSRDNMSTRPARFSPAAAQLLAQSDNAARAQGEMVHKLVAEGYVEVPGTDELVHPADVVERLTGIAGLKPNEVPVILTQGREMSIEECMGMRPSEIGNALAGLKPFDGDLKREADDPYKRYAELVYGSPKCEHMAVKNAGSDERPTLMSPALGLPYGNGPKLADSFVNLLNVEIGGSPKHEYVGDATNLHFTSGDPDPLKLGARERRFFVESTPGSEGLRAFAEMLNISIDSNMAVDMADAWADAFRESLKRQGGGICHGRSARKHRKRGDNVIPLRGGLFAWKAGKLYPYQRAALKQLRGYMDCPAGMGKTMERFTYQGLTGEQVGYRVSTGACVMTYAGEIEHLKGKTALVKKTHSPGNVLAQFDDRRASRTGEPIERFEGAPPTFALGYGWHSFSAFDFMP